VVGRLLPGQCLLRRRSGSVVGLNRLSIVPDTPDSERNAATMADKKIEVADVFRLHLSRRQSCGWSACGWRCAALAVRLCRAAAQDFCAAVPGRLVWTVTFWDMQWGARFLQHRGAALARLTTR